MSLDLQALSNKSAKEIEASLRLQFRDLDHDLKVKAYRRLERAFYENDLFQFALFLGYDRVNWDVHESVIRVLESNCKRKLIVLPRGCYKSTLCTVVYPIWKAIKNPNHRIILDSELMTNSATFLREIEGHLLSEKMTNLYGSFQIKDRIWTSTQIMIAQRNDMTKKEATFVCSGLGAQKTSQHYSIAVLDDMSTPRNTGTPELRQKVIDHYKYYRSLLDPEDGELIIVGTRYHEEDLIGWVIENELDEGQRKALGF